MAFTLKIETDNAAFDENHGEEVARILREIADNLNFGNVFGLDGTARDINGNTVGEWTLDARENDADKEI